MLCVLLGVLNSIKSDELKCQFNVDTDWPSNLWMYGCFVTGLEVKVSDQVFTSVSGIHLPNKNINDVKHLGIEDSKVLFMPQRLDRIFNLRSLLILGTSLVKVQSDDFIGLENLEFLHLGDNVLNYLPSDVFSRLTKNQIKADEATKEFYKICDKNKIITPGVNFIRHPIEKAEILFNRNNHTVDKLEALPAAYRIIKTLQLHTILQNCSSWTLLIYELEDPALKNDAKSVYFDITKK
ncbi:unnamed protein product [Diamesa hyperborea]